MCLADDSPPVDAGVSDEASPASLDEGHAGSFDPRCTDDAMEPNDSPDQATRPTVGTSTTIAGVSCGGDDYFRIAIPTGQALGVALRFAHSDSDLDLYIYDARNTAEVIDFSESLDDVERVMTPLSSEAREMVVRVRNYSGLGAAYRLEVSIVAHAGNDTCDAPVTLTSGQTVDGNTLGGADDLEFNGRSCTGYRNGGNDLFYSVRVPAGRKLRARLSSEIDLSLYLVESCATRCCWAGTDEMTGGLDENLVYVNDTGQEQALVLGVDAYRERRAGAFTLGITVE